MSQIGLAEAFPHTRHYHNTLLHTKHKNLHVWLTFKANAQITIYYHETQVYKWLGAEYVKHEPFSLPSCAVKIINLKSRESNREKIVCKAFNHARVFLFRNKLSFDKVSSCCHFLSFLSNPKKKLLFSRWWKNLLVSIERKWRRKQKEEKTWIFNTFHKYLHDCDIRKADKNKIWVSWKILVFMQTLLFI